MLVERSHSPLHEGSLQLRVSREYLDQTDTALKGPVGTVGERVGEAHVDFRVVFLEALVQQLFSVELGWDVSNLDLRLGLDDVEELVELDAELC